MAVSDILGRCDDDDDDTLIIEKCQTHSHAATKYLYDFDQCERLHGIQKNAMCHLSFSAAASRWICICSLRAVCLCVMAEYDVCDLRVKS